MKTLADMTQEERDECVGMWCDYTTPLGVEKAIYASTRFSKNETLFEPGYGHFEVEDLGRFTPRFDLPRAWNPDGTPALMERKLGGAIRTEYRVVGKIPGLISPASMPSMKDAVDYIVRAERHLLQPGNLKIQYHTITEWEDV